MIQGRSACAEFNTVLAFQLVHCIPNESKRSLHTALINELTPNGKRKRGLSMRFKRFLSILVIICILALPYAAAMGASSDSETIRVGWFPHPGGSEIHGDEHSGYNYDFLMEIAKYTGWTYSFVEADFARCNEMLASGEIDLLGTLLYDEQRAQIFDFPKLAYGHAYTTLYTTQNSDIQPYDFERFDGMRVGVISGAVNADYFRTFAKENGFSFSTVAFESVAALNCAVQDGSVDGGILGAFTTTDDMRVLAEFAPQPYYFATTKGNERVLVGLNRALNLIEINQPYFEMELYQKHFAPPQSLALTDAEQALVEASKRAPITAGLIVDNVPQCYVDPKTGEFVGTFIEMLDAVQERTGLQLVYEAYDLKQGPPVSAVKSGDIPIVIGILKTQRFENDREIVLSNTIYEDSLVVIGRRGEDFTENPGQKAIATLNGFQVGLEFAAEQFPNHRILICESSKACADAVVKGKADAMLFMRDSGSYLLQNPHYEQLEVSPAYSRRIGICAVGLAEEQSTLMSVLNKGLAMITESERNRMVIDYTIMNPYQVTVGDMLYKFRVPFAVILILSATIVAVFVVYGAFRRKSAAALKQAYEQEKSAVESAEKASVAKGCFMSRMSHEIRTPLNAVIGYNSIARHELSQAKTEAQRRQAEMKAMDCLTKGDIASRHLLTIINDVLDMSAIESGRIQVAHERFDFKEMISSLTVLYFSQAKAGGIDFEVAFDTLTEEWFIGDQMRINQILNNLLGNAMKFTSQGGSVRLSICQPEADINAAHIRFEVADTGIGMEEEYLKHIWTPFEQADSSISRRFGGTGLGLSITKSLVDLMGGTIHVTSKRNVGTTFTVDLNLERTKQPEINGAYHFSEMSALVVDDDRSTCEYVKLLFDRCGVRCKTVTSGDAAIEAVAEAKARGDYYTLCLIDWRMPGMDGIETVKRLRQISDAEVPIVIVTAYDYSAIEAEARQAGVNLFAAKPLFQSTLFDLLADISGRQPVEKTEKKDAFDFSGTRVLLAEDNVMNMEIAKRILLSAGVAVDCAWNGREAVALFQSAPSGTYQAILMDVHMPEMDGYEATSAIRECAHPEAATVPIIAMTADAFVENVAEALQVGMNDHIAKPVDIKVLFETLRKHIQ